MGNTFGYIFKLTTFGESHGSYIGGIIDGCPANITLNYDYIQKQLDRRRPGQSQLTTSRNEEDKVEFLSGIFEEKTTGAPIGFLIKNKDNNEKDYDHLKNIYRPSHADFVYQSKYGLRDYKGGGRSSARETACRVVAGAIAKQILEKLEVKITAYVSAIGDIKTAYTYKNLDLSKIDDNIVRCPDLKLAKEMISKVEELKIKGDTIGGKINIIASGIEFGWGEPVFNKLHAEIGKAMLSINAVHAFKYGFEAVDISSSKGSEVNDVLINDRGLTKTNYSGGIQGGISNGNDIYCEISFKPVSTIMKKQKSINSLGDIVDIHPKGRHDVCVVPRAVPIAESMMALCLLDYYLINKTRKI